MDIRTGLGYDLHRLNDEGVFILGNIEIPFEKGFVAHSDGDVLIHAVIDSLLGAAGQGDIGTLFPDTDPQYKNVNSAGLLEKTVDLITGLGYTISNIDATIICQKPKLAPYKKAIRVRTAQLLQIEPDRVSIKAKTKEKVDAVGEGRAVEAFVSCLLIKS